MRLNTKSPLGALGIEPFLKRHWQRKPLFVRDAIPDLAQRLDRDQLFDLAGSDEIESRLIMRSGKTWQVEHGPFRRRALARLPARNWTLLVNGIENFVPAGRTLQSAFSFIPTARHDDVMVSYAVPGGSVGPHFDSYDVFLLQGMGERRWQISAQTDLTLIEDAPLKLLRRFRAQRTMTARPGDLLYLPPSYAHHGVALDECMTWSVGLRAPTYQEFAARFLDFLHDRLAIVGEYRDPDLSAQRHSAALSPAMIGQMQQALRSLPWNQADVACCLGEYLSEPRPRLVFTPPTPALTAHRFAQRARRDGIRLALKTRLLFHGRLLFINGESAPLPAAERRLFECLADQRQIEPRLTVTAAGLMLLHRWYCAGYLELGTR